MNLLIQLFKPYSSITKGLVLANQHLGAKQRTQVINLQILLTQKIAHGGPLNSFIWLQFKSGCLCLYGKFSQVFFQSNPIAGVPMKIACVLSTFERELCKLCYIAATDFRHLMCLTRFLNNCAIL